MTDITKADLMRLLEEKNKIIKEQNQIKALHPYNDGMTLESEIENKLAWRRIQKAMDDFEKALDQYVAQPSRE